MASATLSQRASTLSQRGLANAYPNTANVLRVKANDPRTPYEILRSLSGAEGWRNGLADHKMWAVKWLRLRSANGLLRSANAYPNTANVLRVKANDPRTPYEILRSLSEAEGWPYGFTSSVSNGQAVVRVSR